MNCRTWIFLLAWIGVNAGCFQNLRPQLGTQCDPQDENSCAVGYTCVSLESLEAGRCFPDEQQEEAAELFEETLCDTTCDDGYRVDADCECSDIDECEEFDYCDHICENTDGSYECFCDPGYELNEDEETCDPLEECPECGENASCDETNFTCRCDEGFEGDGETCTNTDDCANSPCQNGATCVDGVNTFSCDCTGTGYSGTLCDQDIDECASSEPDPCVAGATCTNTAGDYACECAGGKVGDGRTDGDGCACDNGYVFVINACTDIPESVSSCPGRVNDLNGQTVSVDVDEATLGEGGDRLWCQMTINEGTPSSVFPCTADAEQRIIDVTALPDQAGNVFAMNGDAAYTISIVTARSDDFDTEGASCTVELDTQAPGATLRLPPLPQADGYLLGLEHVLAMDFADDTAEDLAVWAVTNGSECGSLPAQTAFSCALGSGDADASCTHTLATGAYRLCLEVRDDLGNVSLQHQDDVEVHEPFTVDVRSIPLSDNLRFEITSNHAAASYSCWVAETGTSCEDQEVPPDAATECDDFIFEAQGAGHESAYEFCLVAEDVYGQTVATSTAFTVDHCANQCSPSQLCTIEPGQTDNFEDDCVNLFEVYHEAADGQLELNAGDRLETPAGGFRLLLLRANNLNHYGAVHVQHCAVTLSEGATPIPLARSDELANSVGFFAENPVLGWLNEMPSFAPDTPGAALFRTPFDWLPKEAEADICDGTEDPCWSLYEPGQEVCNNSLTCAGNEMRQITHVDENGTVQCACARKFTNKYCGCSTELEGGLSAHLVPQKLTAFSGSLTLYCEGQAGDSEASLAPFHWEQSFDFEQVAGAGDRCDPTAPNPCGTASGAVVLGRYLEPIPNNQWPRPNCEDPYAQNTDEIACISYPVNEMVCVPDASPRGHHVCSPHPAHLARFFDDSNDNFSFDESSEHEYQRPYCKAHQYPAQTAQGLGTEQECTADFDCHQGATCVGNACVYGCANDGQCLGDETCSNNYCVRALSLTHSLSERCLSYPTDPETGFWDLTKRPPGIGTEVAYDCSSHEDCALGRCIPDGDTKACLATQEEGRLATTDDPAMAGCVWPLFEQTNAAGETVCARACTASNAEACTLEVQACPDAGDATPDLFDGICPLPDWDCYNGQEFLYFGGDAAATEARLWAVGHTSDAQANGAWTWRTHVAFNHDFLSGEKTQVPILEQMGLKLTAEISQNLATIIWKVTEDTNTGCHIETPARSDFFEIEVTKDASSGGSSLGFKMGGIGCEEPITATNNVDLIGHEYTLGIKNSSTPTQTGFWADFIEACWSLAGAPCENDDDCGEGEAAACLTNGAGDATCSPDAEHCRVHLDRDSPDSLNGFEFKNSQNSVVEEIWARDANWSGICDADPEGLNACEAFLSGPFEQLNLGAINLNGTPMLAMQTDTHRRDLAFDANDLGYSPSSGSGSAIWVGVINPAGFQADHHLQITCPQAMDETLRTKHFKTKNNRVYLSGTFTRETNLAQTCQAVAVSGTSQITKTLNWPATTGTGTATQEFILVAELAPGSGWNVNLFTEDDLSVHDLVPAGTPDSAELAYTELVGGIAKLRRVTDLLDNPIFASVTTLGGGDESIQAAAVAATDNDVYWIVTEPNDAQGVDTHLYVCGAVDPDSNWSCGGGNLLAEANNRTVIRAQAGMTHSGGILAVHLSGNNMGATSAVKLYQTTDKSLLTSVTEGLNDNTRFALHPNQIQIVTLTPTGASGVHELREHEHHHTGEGTVSHAAQTLILANANANSSVTGHYLPPAPGESDADLYLGFVLGESLGAVGTTFLTVGDGEAPEPDSDFHLPQAFGVNGDKQHGFLVDFSKGP